MSSSHGLPHISTESSLHKEGDSLFCSHCQDSPIGNKSPCRGRLPTPPHTQGSSHSFPSCPPFPPSPCLEQALCWIAGQPSCVSLQGSNSTATNNLKINPARSDVSREVWKSAPSPPKLPQSCFGHDPLGKIFLGRCRAEPGKHLFPCG